MNIAVRNTYHRNSDRAAKSLQRLVCKKEVVEVDNIQIQIYCERTHELFRMPFITSSNPLLLVHYCGEGETIFTVEAQEISSVVHPLKEFKIDMITA